MKYSICLITILSCCAFHLAEGDEQASPLTPGKCGIRAKAMSESSLLDAQIPSCDDDGNYKKVQCEHWPRASCRCVLPISGVEIPGTEKNGYEKEMKCDIEPPHHPDFPPKKGIQCYKAERIILYEMELGLVDYPLPNCDAWGYYKKVQCSSRKDKLCWCVGIFNGKTIKGTERKNVEESKMKC